MGRDTYNPSYQKNKTTCTQKIDNVWLSQDEIRQEHSQGREESQNIEFRVKSNK